MKTKQNKMNKVINALCFLIVFQTLGCTKGPKLNLISPIGLYVEPPDSILFEWAGLPDEPSKLTISEGNNFDLIITDTILDTNSFLEVGFLPNTTYSWRVIADDQMEEAQFTTLDPIDEVIGVYNIEVHEYWWEANLTLLDTTYQETIELEKMDDKIKAQFERYGIENVLGYSFYKNEKYVYSRLGGLSIGSELYIDRVNRIIEIDAREGGLSYGKVFNVSFSY